MTRLNKVLTKLQNSATQDTYYVCHTPFSARSGGAWSWSVKPNTIFKITPAGDWYVYNLQLDKFVPKYAYNGDDKTFNLKNFGIYQRDWWKAFDDNCDKYIGDSKVKEIIEELKTANEFTGTKKEVIKYLENEDDKTKFIIKRI